MGKKSDMALPVTVAVEGDSGATLGATLLKRMQVVKQRARKRAPGRPTTDQSTQLRDSLINAAMHSFMERGFAASSIEAIARDAKVAKITIYRQFGDKEQLFHAVARYAQTRMQSRLQDILTDDGPPQQVLRNMIMRLFEVTTQPDHLAVLRMGITEAPRFPEVAAMLLSETDFTMAPVISYLDRLKREGLIQVENTRDAAIQLTAVAFGGVRYLIRKPSSDPEKRQHWVDSIYTTFARAWGLEPIPVGSAAASSRPSVETLS